MNSEIQMLILCAKCNHIESRLTGALVVLVNGIH